METTTHLNRWEFLAMAGVEVAAARKTDDILRYAAAKLVQRFARDLLAMNDTDAHRAVIELVTNS